MHCIIIYNNPETTKHLFNIYTIWPYIFDVGPALYKCYTNVLRLRGRWARIYQYARWLTIVLFDSHSLAATTDLKGDMNIMAT